MRNVKAARALLGDHDNDVDKLKEAEPWLFEAAGKHAKGGNHGSGISGMQCFYNCKKLVGGNRTAWSSSNTGYTYMRIAQAGQAGYLTEA